ncbi:ChaN family lipoprotein [Halopseudomonas sabulinigri]|uniref:ChaN family lipoprotein n=1 Tax=Halopseudomonas sabulinigri TaxID=472181 RepID=UPI00333EDB88
MRTLILLLAGMSLSVALSAAELPGWQATEHLDAAHLGEVWSTRGQRWIDADQLVAELAGSDRVVVGEKHDNPDHHHLQLWLLQQLQARRPQAALLMEMLQPGQQAAVTALQHRELPASAALPAQLDWQDGWDWSLYGPLVRWGLQVPQQLLAANLSAEQMMHRYRRPPPISSRYSAAARAQLEQTLLDSHCGMLDAQRVPAMLAIQQGRDEQMARALAEAPAPALLLAGGYHARRDLGVPLHWQSQWGTAPAVVLLWEAGAGELPGYAQADYVWLTPALPEQDYCAGWREH